MQPYFFPYAGYFRLFAAVDEFLVFDCVQFPRRGRVHRTEVPDREGSTRWLTLPLAHQPRETRIDELRFADNARAAFDDRLAMLPWVSSGAGPTADRLRALLLGPLDRPLEFVERSLRLVLDVLRLDVPMTRTSALQLDPTLQGPDRVIAAARAVGATEYLNSPGGRVLYDARVFAQHGLALLFLEPYAGRYFHLLHALMTEQTSDIRAEVLAGSTPVPA
jgi:hypothetical protein